MILDGKILPKGATALISPVAIGRSDSVWENAQSFIPERFSLENMEKKSAYSFVVFGAGPRNCKLSFIL